MGKKYLDTKNNSLESSVLGVWETAIEEGEAIRDAAQMTKEPKRVNKELDEDWAQTMALIWMGTLIAALLPALYMSATALAGPPIKSLVDKLKKNKNYKLSKSEKDDVEGFMSKVNKEKPSLFKKVMQKIKKEEVELPDMRDALMQVRTEKHDTHVDPEDRDELDKEPDGAGGVETAKKMKKAKEPAPNISEASGDKEAYKKFFDAALKKFKVSSPAELKGDQKKKFFDYIDKNWEADNEKAEAAMSQVREFKIQSMKAALARVWGMKEGKNPFKKEDDDKENKKRVKTETGKKAAVIDLNPKIAD